MVAGTVWVKVVGLDPKTLAVKERARAAVVAVTRAYVVTLGPHADEHVWYLPTGGCISSSDGHAWHLPTGGLRWMIQDESLDKVRALAESVTHKAPMPTLIAP